MRRGTHSVLIAGLGGDAHSVGLALIRFGLQSAGFRVQTMGIQNTITEIVSEAEGFDAVFVSCMDGHAFHYLRPYANSLPDLLSKRLWYLGGHPVIDNNVTERPFLEMGFRRVFLSFVEISKVIEFLCNDLVGVDPVPAKIAPERENTRVLGYVDDGLVPFPEFLEERTSVLEQWPTGRGARSLDENAGFLRARPNLSSIQQVSQEKLRRPLLQPRAGVATSAEQMSLFQYLQRAGADVLSFQIDSLTRNNDYRRAAEGVRESKATGRSALNGFPLVNHGVSTVRAIARQVNVPLQVRHSTRDPRLLAEIALASGISAFEGGAICYNIPYYKDYYLSESIRAWRYVDRLCGEYYTRYGIIIDREFFGVLTATLIPPCLAIATGILESLLAAEQGVQAVSIGYAEQGNRVQDIAALGAAENLSRQWLDRYGFSGVAARTVFHQYMAAFPPDYAKAESLIYESAVTGYLGSATRVLIKTPVEAIKIPSRQDNVAALQICGRAFEFAKYQSADEQQILAERLLIEEEVTELLERVIELGKGSIGNGIIRAFRDGSLDVPFAPSLHNMGSVMTARDRAGRIRFLNFGNLPFSGKIKAFHRERMAERRNRENSRFTDVDLVVGDVLFVSRGKYLRWPIESLLVS